MKFEGEVLICFIFLIIIIVGWLLSVFTSKKTANDLKIKKEIKNEVKKIQKDVKVEIQNKIKEEVGKKKDKKPPSREKKVVVNKRSKPSDIQSNYIGRRKYIPGESDIVPGRRQSDWEQASVIWLKYLKENKVTSEQFKLFLNEYNKYKKSK